MSFLPLTSQNSSNQSQPLYSCGEKILYKVPTDFSREPGDQIRNKLQEKFSCFLPVLPSIPTSSPLLVALLKQLVENESGKFPSVYSCPFNLHLTNPPQVKELTCGVFSSESCRSTNTAVQIWHIGFLISYLLAGQIAVRFQGRLTHLLSERKKE